MCPSYAEMLNMKPLGSQLWFICMHFMCFPPKTFPNAFEHICNMFLSGTLTKPESTPEAGWSKDSTSWSIFIISYFILYISPMKGKGCFLNLFSVINLVITFEITFQKYVRLHIYYIHQKVIKTHNTGWLNSMSFFINMTFVLSNQSRTGNCLHIISCKCCIITDGLLWTLMNLWE